LRAAYLLRLMPARACIGDYAPIGDCRAAAMVSRLGSIDWLCWPRFDAPSLFGALLDDDGGSWRLAPAGPFSARRSYVADTNVLCTTFVTDGGRLTVIDFMPVASEADKHRELWPDHEILRIARCEAGEVELEQRFEPRPGYGRAPHLRDGGALGLRVEAKEGTATLRTTMPLVRDDRGARGTVRLRAGDTVYAALGFADDWPAVLPPLGLPSERALARTIDWWRRWTARITYDGPFAAAVRRSALAIKLLCYAPSGAVVAAPTTSLPERVGGDLNWDYRFCWLRDASLTVRALIAIGYEDEAEAFTSWLIHSTRLTRPRLKILYDVYGNHPAKERELKRWRGFDGSRPVRVGNAAVEQLQLDVYGEVIDAVAQLVRQRDVRVDRETQRMLRGFGEYVCDHWGVPDEGIWEPRTGRAPHTHSRLLCWVAVDRLIELGQRGCVRKLDLPRLRRVRDELRRDLETHSWNDELKSYVAVPGTRELDATLLLMAWYGFVDAGSQRMHATWRRVREELGVDGLLYRYKNGDSPGEGAFGICSFWAAEYLALGGGTVDDAEEAMRAVLARSNDVGLFAEEIDPETGEALGNFPQAFSHVGLINAAITIERRRRAALAPHKEVQA